MSLLFPFSCFLAWISQQQAYTLRKKFEILATGSVENTDFLYKAPCKDSNVSGKLTGSFFKVAELKLQATYYWLM
jgi:hypothetical protein